MLSPPSESGKQGTTGHRLIFGPGAASHDRRLGCPIFLIHRAISRIGALGIVARIIRIIGASLTQRCISSGLIQRDAGMTKGFERGAAIGAGDSVRLDCLAAFGTVGHGRGTVIDLFSIYSNFTRSRRDGRPARLYSPPKRMGRPSLCDDLIFSRFGKREGLS
jgi:hypothetical protein